jgi:hypothetical protein
VFDDDLDGRPRLVFGQSRLLAHEAHEFIHHDNPFMNTTWELEVGSWKFSDSHLSVSPVALAARRFRLRLTPPIGRKGSTDVIHLLEASLFVATRVHLVSTGIDQLAFRCAMCHLRLLADSTQIEYPQVAPSPRSA